ncbi:MAG: UV DNA damage repair endonuclease UvsE [Candidatus Thorarchaeota archaeon]|nr:MAG: UV DNA damage repair endonuclease UvsE [Candidatus Thorarchaeota archaeon]
MRIGYPCINLRIGCTSSATFRLKSYTEERLVSKIESNLDCLQKILEFNVDNQILNFRITSDLVPFASHPICKYDWMSHFAGEFARIGRYAKKEGIRLSMHPGQYTVLNSPHERVLMNSIVELEYHASVLDLLKADRTAKIQIHVGGVYGNKEAAMSRFLVNYDELDRRVSRRLVVENDEKSYTVNDLLMLNELAQIPIVLDTLHHEANDSGMKLEQAIELSSTTWNGGSPAIVDYSSQAPEGRAGKHAETIDIIHFQRFLEQSVGYDFDLMLEIKDKESSAIKAIGVAKSDSRFIPKPMLTV